MEIKVNYQSIIMLPLMVLGFALQGSNSDWSYFFYATVILILLMTLNSYKEFTKSELNDKEKKE